LAGLTFAEVVTDERSDEQSAGDSEELAPVASQESLQQVQDVMLALEAMQRQIDAIQQAKQEYRLEALQSRRDAVSWFALGFLVAGFLFLGMVLLSWLYGG
jgi:hypothetical protein